MKKYIFWLRLFILHQYDNKAVCFKRYARKQEWIRQKEWDFEYIDKLGRIDFSNA